MSAVSVVAWLLGAVALAAINNGESFYLKITGNVGTCHKKSINRALQKVAFVKH